MFVRFYVYYLAQLPIDRGVNMSQSPVFVSLSKGKWNLAPFFTLLTIGAICNIALKNAYISLFIQRFLTTATDNLQSRAY